MTQTAKPNIWSHMRYENLIPPEWLLNQTPAQHTKVKWPAHDTSKSGKLSLSSPLFSLLSYLKNYERIKSYSFTPLWPWKCYSEKNYLVSHAVWILQSSAATVLLLFHRTVSIAAHIILDCNHLLIYQSLPHTDYELLEDRDQVLDH